MCPFPLSCREGVFLIFDAPMKKVVAYRFVIRAGSVVTVLSLLVLRLLAGQGGMTGVAEVFQGGCFLLLLYPLKGENSRQAVVQMLVFMSLMAAGECFPRWQSPVWQGALPLLLAAVYQERKRVWARGIMGENRLLYACLALTFRSLADGWLLLPLYLIMYALAYFGEAFHLEAWRNAIRRRSTGGRCDRAQMQNLFKRALHLLEKERPYLNPRYKEDDMAQSLFTNRVYLSQTINAIGGMNFKMLLNTYRVQYAIALIRKNPVMNIKQVATNSGFSSSNVFITAFRMVTGESPQQFLSRTRGEGP